MIQTLTNPSSINLVGITYILESIALAVAYSGGVQKYVLTDTAITLGLSVSSVPYYNTLTFFPGSKS